VYTFWVYLPLVAAALIWNLYAGAIVWAVCLISGLALWTPIEYVVHRYALHRLAPHYQHHDEPTVVAYIFAPLWLSGGSALILWGLLALATGSWRRGALVEAGTILGYLFYEAVHVRIHSAAAGGPILRALRKHHFYHHFADDTRCFGVTSGIWDRIFRTAARPERG
jgi:sterol desaturase/sphingolipid hydroxylase (fatty acid hydroxylase superfamily)